jgi:hypothetical protein
MSGWFEYNFRYAGDSVNYTSVDNTRKEVAFFEGTKVVRHNVILNIGTGTRTEIRRFGTLVYNGSQLTKITYKTYEYKFTGSSTVPVITATNPLDYNYKYDANGNVTNVENVVNPTGGGVGSSYKTLILSYSTQKLPNSATVPFYFLRQELFNSYLLGFTTQLKMYNNIPGTFGLTDRSFSPARVRAYTYTPTTDVKGNISKIVEISGTRTLTYDFTYKCP